jgi:4'-phosphopantetheinyl transferase
LYVIKPNEVHIWWARTDSPEWDITQLASVLSDDEINRADRFHFPHHRRRFIAAHGLVRLILGNYLDRAPGSVHLLRGLKGKPYLEKIAIGPSLCFNLSHSNDLAMVGITLDRRIGVDVEHIRPLSNLESIAGRYFSKDEIHGILNAPANEREQLFFHHWTMKESYLKATGAGLSGLQGIQITHDKSGIDSRTAIVIDQSNQSWFIEQFQLTLGYAASVAVEGETSVATVLRQFSSGLGK